MTPYRSAEFISAVSQRATSWQLPERSLECGQTPLLMGIVNVTPDSFSDGGKFLDISAAVEHGLQLVRDGADILDIGGESTRPYSEPIGDQEEVDRVMPVIDQLVRVVDAPVSVDTSKASVASIAVAIGAEIINDVTGLTGDPEMLPLAVASKAGVCAMHMQGTPQTMQDNPHYDDLIAEIADYLASRRDALLAAGIASGRICLDPGVGFGKTHQHNLDLMADCWQFHRLGCPLLVGHSRKGFFGKILRDKQADRAAATAGASAALAVQGVQILRVHDVRTVRETLAGFTACGGIDGEALKLGE